MQNISLAICDDDLFSLDAISGSILSTFQRFGFQPTLEKYSSSLALKEAFPNKNYDLIFLDIDMPDLDGIEIGKIIKSHDNPPDIIFVSAREERVFDSLSVHPFGFIRKNSFLIDVTKVVENYCQNKKKSGEDKTFNLVSKGKIIHLEINDIIYIESYRDYQNLYQKGKNDALILSSTMETLEEKLKPFGFIRIHKSYLVNYRYIARIETGDVLLVNGKKLDLSRRKLQEVRQAYLKLLHDSDNSIMVSNN